MDYVTIQQAELQLCFKALGVCMAVLMVMLLLLFLQVNHISSHLDGPARYSTQIVADALKTIKDNTDRTDTISPTPRRFSKLGEDSICRMVDSGVIQMVDSPKHVPFNFTED